MNFAEITSLSWALLLLLFGTLIRSTLLALICAVVALFLRSKTAEIRHMLWRGMLFALLLLPLLEIFAPPLQRTSRSLAAMQAAVLPSARPEGVITGIADSPATVTLRPVRQHESSFLWVLIAVFIYAAITLVLLARLAISLFRLGTIVRRSRYIGSQRLRELAHDVWLENGGWIKPRIRESDDVGVPVAVDFDEMFILLPESWRQWDTAKLRAVMAHEMAHVTRDDPATALIASIAACLFWFHPLAWFLKRHLALLAEEACDEFAVHAVSNPEQYATVLIDFARDVAMRGKRVLEPASAVVHGSHLKRRMSRIFEPSANRNRGATVLRVMLLAAFVPALYVTAAARFQEPQAQNTPVVIQRMPLTPDEVAQLQARLEANPDDLTIRGQLLMYYRQQGHRAEFLQQLLWIIQNHPESPMALSPLPPDEYDQVKPAWEQALATHAASPQVLSNAARFFQTTDPERALQLFQRARELDSSPKSVLYLGQIARIYAEAVIVDLRTGIQPKIFPNLRPEAAASLRTQLQQSSDPALLSQTGELLIEMNTPPLPQQKEMGLQLIQRAIDLDPSNPEWKAALEFAQAERMRLKAIPAGAVPIGGKVAEANLIKKVEPVYPPLALAARVQGDVEFSAVIGTDGHVQSLTLVRGHPLLVNAAKDAVLQWIYRPTLLNGQPVSVQTDILVPFRLP